ncbi:YceI family protein [Methylovirgula sp. HY1]|uniref:YceI family protein n=1 Tax=Methylovirgula sp. HY1 TaxID=2822761 RepID=UPI001C5B5367|nr:YceI family protein [Methylovirgula sp. HY1]QXX76579.1 Protein YceI [Methylovirgula sp. HY1]
MKIRFLAAGVVATLLALSSLPPNAVAQQVASKNPNAVRAGTYKVEPYHTQISFSISHFGFSNFSGFFSGASGALELDPVKLSLSKLDVSVPVQSVLTTVPRLTDELKDDKWFDAAKFPKATFVSTKIIRTGRDTATVFGKLTLHGVTKPVVLKARLVGAGINPLDKSFTVGFEATGTIKRSDFGIKQYLPLLGDDVSLKIAGAFVLQP